MWFRNELSSLADVSLYLARWILIGFVHLGFKTGPLCPMFYIKLKEPCSFNKVPHGPPPYLIPNYLRVHKKKRNPGIKVKVIMHRCLLPELHLILAFRRILTGVPSCGAPLRLWIILSLDPTGSGENLRVQKEGTQVSLSKLLCTVAFYRSST
jgi:hypothetical protein